LGGESYFTLTILDSKGNPIEVLAQGTRGAGRYYEVWNAGSRASGTYYYRLVAGSFDQTKKMLLSR